MDSIAARACGLFGKRGADGSILKKLVKQAAANGSAIRVEGGAKLELSEEAGSAA